jgi:hypothetical protein
MIYNENSFWDGAFFFERRKIRYQDTKDQEIIMAFVHAAAPIKKDEAIEVLSKDLGLDRVDLNIQTLIDDDIFKTVGSYLFVNTINPDSKEICLQAFDKHLQKIIDLCHNL